MTGRIRARERPYDAAVTPRKDNIHLFEKILAFNIYLW